MKHKPMIAYITTVMTYFSSIIWNNYNQLNIVLDPLDLYRFNEIIFSVVWVEIYCYHSMFWKSIKLILKILDYIVELLKKQNNSSYVIVQTIELLVSYVNINFHKVVLKTQFCLNMVKSYDIYWVVNFSVSTTCYQTSFPCDYGKVCLDWRHICDGT